MTILANNKYKLGSVCRRCGVEKKSQGQDYEYVVIGGTEAQELAYLTFSFLFLTTYASGFLIERFFLFFAIDIIIDNHQPHEKF